MTLPEHLLSLRLGSGLSQKEIARALGISTLTYQRYEYGERDPKSAVLIALADYYKLSLDELVCREWPPRP